MAPGRRLDDLWMRWDKRVRDSIIFIVGILGVVHELFIIPEPRPYALLFLASLIGIPFVLAQDETKNRPPGWTPSENPPPSRNVDDSGDGG